MPFSFQRHEDPRTVRPGDYAPIHWRVASTPQVHVSAVVCCPTCGRGLSIAARVHRISMDGTLVPSLVCPYGCGFHAFVRLDAWVPGEADPIANREGAQ